MKLLFENWRKYLTEGVNQETGEIEHKYYAFDWDDNLMRMPTSIYLKDEQGNEVEMSTADFAKYREKIGKEKFEYNGAIVNGYDKNPFRGFRVEGDEKFKIDVMNAPTADAWPKFVEAVNSGSYFAIITARGHGRFAMFQAIESLIEKNHEGLSKAALMDSLVEYEKSKQVDSTLTPEELLSMYYEKIMQHIYPVSNDSVAAELGGGSADSPEEAKVEAMRRFRDDMKIANDDQLIKIGFSDDDYHNIETMAGAFSADDVKLFYTGPERD